MRNGRALAFALSCVLAGPAGLPAQGVPSLALGILQDVDSVPFVVADLQGFFREAGVEVRLERFPSAVNRDAALQAGAVDAAVSDLLAATFALEGGFPVAAVQATQGVYRLMGAPGSPARSVRDLRGKRIGISKNTIIEYALDRMLEEAGMREDDVVKEAIPQMPVRLEMLRAGRLDAAVLPEPLATSAALDGAAAIDGTDRMGINPGILLASRAALERKPEAFRALRAAYDRAAAWLSAAPRKDWEAAVVEKAGFPPAVRSAMVLPAYTPAAAAAESETRAVSSWLLRRGLTKREHAYGEYLPREKGERP